MCVRLISVTLFIWTGYADIPLKVFLILRQLLKHVWVIVPRLGQRMLNNFVEGIPKWLASCFDWFGIQQLCYVPFK